ILEDKLRTELHNTSEVSRRNFQECRTSQGTIRTTELRVIEDVERLRTELKRHALLDREMFEQAHVKVGPVWIAQIVSTYVTERQACRGNKRIRVVEISSVVVRCNLTAAGNILPGITNHVWVRARSNPIANAGIVAICGAVGYVQRSASREAK